MLATVEKERSIDRGRDDWNDTMAVLAVRETWKGKAAAIEVSYPAHMICPAPPRYEDGLTVLAFTTPP